MNFLIDGITAEKEFPKHTVTGSDSAASNVFSLVKQVRDYYTCVERDEQLKLKPKPSDSDISHRHYLNMGTILMDQISGRVIMIDGEKAIVEFIKNERKIKRSISMAKLEQMGVSDVRPGDAIALISYKTGNSIQTRIEYLGRATVKPDPSRLDKIDKLYRREINKNK